MSILRRAGWAALALVVSVRPTLAADGPSATAQNTFEATVERVLRSAYMEPNNPERWYTLAKIYSDKVRTDPKLPREMANTYIKRGLEHAEKALMINDKYYEALELKSMLLRQQAEREDDPAVRKKIIALADSVRAIAARLRVHRLNRGV